MEAIPTFRATRRMCIEPKSHADLDHDPDHNRPVGQKIPGENEVGLFSILKKADHEVHRKKHQKRRPRKLAATVSDDPTEDRHEDEHEEPVLNEKTMHDHDSIHPIRRTRRL